MQARILARPPQPPGADWEPGGPGRCQARCQRAWLAGPEVPASARVWHCRSIHSGAGGADRAGLE